VRINENISGFQHLRNQTRDSTGVERELSRVHKHGESATAPAEAVAEVAKQALDRVAAENAAASLSRVRDASLAAQLASMTASQILENGPMALAAQANVAPETVVALLHD
jgi:hypothetical protein